jgi:hypothetical protein
MSPSSSVATTSASPRRVAALSIWLAVVLFIYPIPHTIALRNLILFVGLIAMLWWLRPRAAGVAALRETLAGCAPIGAVVLVLSTWMVVQSATLGMYPAESLAMWSGDWLIALLVAGLGVLAATTIGDRPEARGRLAAGAVLGLFANIVWYLAYQALRLFHGEPGGLDLTPFAARDYHSVINNTLFALLLAEALFRAIAKRRFVPFPSSLVLLMLALSMLTTYMLATRNGTVGVVAMLLLALVFWLQATGGLFNRRALLLIALGAVAVAGFLTLTVKADSRWQSFAESTRAGLDIENNRAWIDNSQPLPLTASGTSVDESAYDRAAWARAALEQIGAHPLGVGYGNRSFGWALFDRYHAGLDLQSCHNGLLDFTVANGLPGIALWLLLTWLLCLHGWRQFRRHASPAGLFLLFSVVCYFLRVALDGHLGGFRMEMYALLVGVTLALAKRPNGWPGREGKP